MNRLALGSCVACLGLNKIGLFTFDVTTIACCTHGNPFYLWYFALLAVSASIQTSMVIKCAPRWTFIVDGGWQLSPRAHGMFIIWSHLMYQWSYFIAT